MLDLLKALGLGLVVLLPLANPLTTVALFLGLTGGMSITARNRIAFLASVNVFIIMMVTYYAGQVVMNTFGISIPGLRIAGGLIVAFIGFRMLFPQPARPVILESTSTAQASSVDTSIAFVPLAMPSTAGPGTIAMIISSASTSAARHSAEYAPWIILTAPPLIFILVSAILWISLRSSGSIMRLVGVSGIDAVSRLMGFLLVCTGTQFIINGTLEIISTWNG
ncbi:UNVERIFIED_ORG: multiple antibiotic resistance protein [Rahnella aquatilis]